MNPFRYTGRDFDSETGLSYYRARYYDSQMGRFLSEDPITYDGGNDFYAYASNNPTNMVDPFGWFPKGKDKWFGYNNGDFQKWFHRCWKQPGDPDAGKDEIIDAYNEWVDRGKPSGGKCWNKRPCDKQPQEEPETSPNDNNFFKNLNRMLNYPFGGPFWDTVRDWQNQIERGPQPVSGPAPIGGPVPLPVPIIPPIP